MSRALGMSADPRRHAKRLAKSPQAWHVARSSTANRGQAARQMRQAAFEQFAGVPREARPLSRRAFQRLRQRYVEVQRAAHR